MSGNLLHIVSTESTRDNEMSDISALTAIVERKKKTLSPTVFHTSLPNTVLLINTPLQLAIYSLFRPDPDHLLQGSPELVHRQKKEILFLEET